MKCLGSDSFREESTNRRYILSMQELFRKTPHDSLAKWQIMTLVKYWKLDDCRLYKSETNAFLERVELVPELARCIALKTRR